MSQTIETKTAPTARPRNLANFVVPAVNIQRNADGYTLEVEMPGVPQGGVDVTIEEGKLILVGRRVTESAEGLIYRESPEADYRRVFDLDPTIENSRIEARIEQGLLTVRLPKAESAKPRRIAVS